MQSTTVPETTESSKGTEKQLQSRLERRTLLRGLGAAATVASTSLSGCVSILFSTGGGGGAQNSGAPMSFVSQRKRVRKQDATIVVNNRSQLVSAVQKPDTVVWIPENATIDMTGDTENPIAPGVTIASNRNLGEGKGGTIKTTRYDRRVFVVPEGSCRVTGIRLIGPQKAYIDPPYENIYDYAASGIHFEGKSAIVDNCELAGWTSYAIGLGSTHPTPSPTPAWIHHNYCHHCQMNHLGYFVESYDGMMLIEWNDFSYYRHAISGYGFSTNGYEARFNRVGPGGGSPYTWTFDMHSLGEQDNYPASNTTGGKYLNIHHNVFETPDSLAMSLSGVPTKYARFVNNWCIDNEGMIDGEPGAELRVKQNLYGSEAIKKGRQWLGKVVAQIPPSNGVPSLAPWTPPSKESRGNATNSTPNSTSSNTSKRMALPPEVK